jgi:HSP20 family protein
MTITRWNPVTLSPVRDLFSTRDEFNRLLDTFFTGSPVRGDLAPAFTPAVDIEETAEEFIFKADLPGMSQKDVKVNLMGDTLTIRGERKQESEHKEGGMHRTERIYGAFERTFRLGTPVRSDQVKAQYRDGVLEVHVPKAEEAKLREVEVQVAS